MTFNHLWFPQECAYKNDVTENENSSTHGFPWHHYMAGESSSSVEKVTSNVRNTSKVKDIKLEGRIIQVVPVKLNSHITLGK